MICTDMIHIRIYYTMIYLNVVFVFDLTIVHQQVPGSQEIRTGKKATPKKVCRLH